MPPCIRAIHKLLASGANVPHRARLAFASFMLQMGVEPDDVARQFSRTPNHDPEKTRRIVRDLKRDGYLPQSCKTMAVDKLCTDAMKQNLCSSIRNPLSWGRIRTGTVISGPRVDAPDTVPTIAFCKCGLRLGPVIGMEMARQLANQHYWAQPVEVENDHAEVHYETCGLSAGS